MTENKRFTVDGLTITENSQKGRKYLLEYQGGVNALCNRINGLFDKSKRLEKENKELQEFKDKVFNLIDKRIRTLEANSKQCHQGWSHEKGIEFTLQAELLKRLKKELQE